MMHVAPLATLASLDSPVAVPELAPPASAPPVDSAPVEPNPLDRMQAYHTLAELSARPILVTPVELLIPQEQPLFDERSHLRMRLLISEEGRVDEVVVDQSTLTPTLQSEVIARFAAARYQPGEIDGQPVRSQILIEVRPDGA